MKSRILVVLALCFIMGSIAAQKPFTGKIVYDITYVGEAITEQVLSVLPKQLEVLIDDGKSKSTINTPMGDQVSIVDTEKFSSTNLVDIMGQKFAINIDSNEIKQELSMFPDLRIEYPEESKELVGYSCKVANVVLTDGTSYKVYYAEDLHLNGYNFTDPLFYQIEPFLLQFEREARGVLMRFTVNSIEEMKVSKNEFEIPKDYKTTTKKALKDMLGSF